MTVSSRIGLTAELANAAFDEAEPLRHREPRQAATHIFQRQHRFNIIRRLIVLIICPWFGFISFGEAISLQGRIFLGILE